MTTKPTPERLLSLDAFRGATIAGMILVNNSGDYASTWWPLLHQPWHGWTPTDLVFPFFLWMAGMSLVFSRRIGFRAALWRSVKLVLLGLLVNFTTGGFTLPLRWAGVLQRIGLCYLAAWAAKQYLKPRGQAILAASLLLGYWAVMTQRRRPRGLRPEPGAADEPVRAGRPHRARRPPLPVDEDLGPRGRAVHVPRDRDRAARAADGGLAPLEPRAAAQGDRVRRLRAGAFGLGVLWGEAAPPWLLFPVNKNLWSPSFVLLTGGLASALFGLTWWVVDVRGVRGWTGPFVTYGKNAIAVYVAAEVFSGVLGTVSWASAGGAVLSLQERLHEALFASWLPPTPAAFAYALANVLLFWALAWWMDRRGIYLKV